MGFEQVIHQSLNLLEVELCCGVGIQHRGMVNVLSITGLQSLNGQGLRAEIGLDHRSELRR